MAQANEDRVKRIAKSQNGSSSKKKAPLPKVSGDLSVQARRRRRSARRQVADYAIYISQKLKKSPNKTSRAPRAQTPPPAPAQKVHSIDDSDSESSSASSDDDDRPIPRPAPSQPKPVIKEEPRASGSNGYAHTNGKGKEKEIRTGQSVVKKAPAKKPSYQGTPRLLTSALGLSAY
jgi:hypothetical protein